MAEKVVELEIVEAIRHETIRQPLKKADRRVNNKQSGVNRQFRIDDARTKLKSLYPKIKI